MHENASFAHPTSRTAGDSDIGLSAQHPLEGADGQTGSACSLIAYLAMS